MEILCTPIAGTPEVFFKKKVNAMGTPNKAMMAEELVQAFLSPERQLPEEFLHQSGLDVAILKEVYEQEVRSNLRDITLHKPADDESFQRLLSDSLKSGVLARFGQVPSARILWQDFRYPEGELLNLRVWLTRGGAWHYWFACFTARSWDMTTGARDYTNEEAGSADGPAELCAELFDKLPAGLYRNGNRDKFSPRYIPMMLARGLTEALDKSIERREQLLAEQRSVRDRVHQRLSAVKYYAY